MAVRIQRIERLHCGICAQLRRVKIRLTPESEVWPDCVQCGPTTWISFPKLAPQEITVDQWLDDADPLDRMLAMIRRPEDDDSCPE